ncbi:MAG TPA: bifunctional adenosylcobinamide kinase/adenosylcobinamide-phosphate guanylyltransferase [Chloroflexota bacterium]
MKDKELILVLGGARGGKSTFAESLARSLGERVLYVATATGIDEEMRQRIRAHQRARGGAWRTVEVPLGVEAAVRQHGADVDVVLLDCLTLLVANVLVGPGHDQLDEERLDQEALERTVAAEVSGLVAAYEAGPASLVVVSNEVGMGVVPAYAIGRVYRDLLGKANQMLAARADRVYLLVAGIPLEIKALAATLPGVTSGLPLSS